MQGMRRLIGHRLSRVQYWLIVCLAVLIGVGLSSHLSRVGGFWAVPCWFIVFLLYRWRTILCAFIVVVSGIVIGVQRGDIYLDNTLQLQSLIGTKQLVYAVATSDGHYDARKQNSFSVSSIRVGNQTFHGTGQISGFGANTVLSGDTIAAYGTIRQGFGSSQMQMGFADITVLSRSHNPISELRRNFANGIQSAVPEPAASLGLGILIGQRSTLPKPIKDNLLHVGLTHIIAVSGYNLTIIIRALQRLPMRLSKKSKTLLSFAAIATFLMMTGNSASIQRAAIVSVLSIVAAYYGRRFQPLLLVLLVATITAYGNPYYVWGDASWYLSMLAFTGILLLAPVIIERFKITNVILLLLVETIAAELMTIPYILTMFSQLSVIGLLANVLIVPLVPFAMLTSFVAGIAGMVWPALVGWVSWPATISLTSIIDIAHQLARIPHSFLEHLQLSVIGMLVLYVVILAWLLMLHNKTKRLRRARITDINLSQPTILAEESI